MDNFLGQITELDNNNQASFSPIDPTQHGVKNAYGTVIHTAGLVARPRPNTPVIVMEADCQASEEVAFTTNNFDGKAELNEGDFGIQNPLNGNIEVITGENKVLIKAGTSTIEILEDGNIQIISNGNISQQAGTSSLTITNDGNISMSVGGTTVANFTQTAINFLVPINAPAGSTVKNQLIAINGGITTGHPLTHTITTPQP